MLHTWANIALIFLITLSIIAWAVPLVLLLFTLKGMHKVRGHADRLMPQVQQRARQAATIVEQGSYKAVRPVIWAHAQWYGIQAVIHALRHRPPTYTNHHEDEVSS